MREYAIITEKLRGVVMKKIFCLVFALLLVFSFSACKGKDEGNSEDTQPATQAPTMPSHQELLDDEIDVNDEAPLRMSLKEAGLEDVLIRGITDEKVVSDGVVGRAYLLADDSYDSVSRANHYLALYTEEKVYIKELGKGCPKGSIFLYDTDGDNDCEIISVEDAGGNGGAGSFLCSVFDFRDGDIFEMFAANPIKEFDTGFSCQVQEGNSIEIINSNTDYSQVVYPDRNEEYFDSFYDENGELKETKLYVDSFYEFIPEDVDSDGVYEIVGKQYTWIQFHADYIGSAVTVLKYNNEAETFEVVDAWFETPDEKTE